MAKEEKKSFETSFEEIQKIIEKIEGGKVSLSQLETELEKAATLLNFCKSELEKIESKVIHN